MTTPTELAEQVGHARGINDARGRIIDLAKTAANEGDRKWVLRLVECSRTLGELITCEENKS